MPRVNESHVQLPDGRRIGFSLTDRPTGYRVRFLAPDGRRVERSTGCTKKGDARAEAERIVLAEYAPAPDELPQSATWEEAVAHLEQSPDLRLDTVRAYKTAVRAVRLVLPALAGPSDVTPELAHKFKRQFLAGEYARGKASDAADLQAVAHVLHDLPTGASVLVVPPLDSGGVRREQPVDGSSVPERPEGEAGPRPRGRRGDCILSRGWPAGTPAGNYHDYS